MNEEIEVEDALQEAPSSIWDICETDTAAEEEGRWFKDVFDDGNNINLKLRRMTCKKSMAVRRRLDKQYKNHRNKKDGTFSEEIGTKILIKQIASAVLIDWENITDRDGSKIDFSPEAAEMLMTRLPAFRDLIIALSMDMDNFRIEQTEEAEKN
jgi:hypothetical protein